MTYLQAIVPLIEDAYSGLWKNAEPLAEKLDYKASDTTRTPLDILQECAQVPGFLVQTIRDRKMSENPEAYAQFEADKASLTTVDACRQYFEQTKGELFDAIAGFPEEKLLEEIEMPWGTYSWRDVIAYLYWNPRYHTGQLAYIQMIHGDKEMH